MSIIAQMLGNNTVKNVAFWNSFYFILEFIVMKHHCSR